MMDIRLSPRSPIPSNGPNVSRPESPASGANSPTSTNTNPARSTTLSNNTPSSPFQTDVDQENARPRDSQKQDLKPTIIASPANEQNKENMDEPTLKRLFESPQDKKSHTSPTKTPRKPLTPSKRTNLESPRTNNVARDAFPTITMEDLWRESNDTAEARTNDDRSVMSDDTCFSAFSAIPNADMTKFASIGKSPLKTFASPSKRSEIGMTPSNSTFFTPGTSRRHHRIEASQDQSASPTPKRNQSNSRDSDTTSLLLDFTQSFDTSKPRYNLTKETQLSPSKSTTEPNLLAHLNNKHMPSPKKNTAGAPGTPASKRNLLTLLDFDLPPQPTPRSVPSITIRELESLKSSYLSEISSLKASLSGREAEVKSLKSAVNDAERRVGEALENAREERNAREHAGKEKNEWEKKGQEIECVMQNVREEFVYSEKEKEELLQKLEESNRLKDEAELKVAEAATKANVAQSEVGLDLDKGDGHGQLSEGVVQQRVAQQLDEKMENLARELHAVYKKKHESKVATLKKTYETRSEKKCSELQQKIQDLTKQNEELQVVRDATFSGTIPDQLASEKAPEVNAKQLEEQNLELKEHIAKIAGLKEEIHTMQGSHTRLMQELEAERIEKGELVAAVDEMLALQSEVGNPAPNDFRKSLSRPSGLKAPHMGSQSGLAKPGSFGKSRMMSNIERMGGGRVT